MDNFYQSLFSTCKMWAEQPETPPFQALMQCFPQYNPPPGFDVTLMAVTFGANTDLSNATKLYNFRSFIHSFVTSKGGVNALQVPNDELWYNKDAGQMLCELLVFRDLRDVQAELIATIVSAVISFGEDAISVIGFLVGFRVVYQAGRGAVPENAQETQWLLQMTMRSMQRAKEYMLSEQFGELNAIDVIRDLL
eukprot:c2314_g1_i2.p1 GENE.c2314_g1_i2~~c2314_g1_i2.p1  ORF type:complete len:203 (-),score=40.29 c2314_g1_i2:61-642(-)